MKTDLLKSFIFMFFICCSRFSRFKKAFSCIRVSVIAGLLIMSLLYCPPTNAEPPGGLEFTGVIYPLRDLSLSMGVGGVVSRVAVELGQSVSKGDLLIQLDDRQQAIEAMRRKVIFEDQSEINSMRRRQEILALLYEDARALYEEVGSISREELYGLELEYIAARGRLEQLEVHKERERLEYLAAVEDQNIRKLKAPINGVVTWFEVDEGEWVEPEEKLMRIVDAITLVLRINVPEFITRGLNAGAAMPVRGGDGNGSFSLPGKISFVSPAADPSSGLVEIRVDFSNKDNVVRPGTRGSIIIGN
jgi:RND family efflux transporter MFP subunit